MPALVAGIHAFLGSKQGVDGRDKPGHDDRWFSASGKTLAVMPLTRRTMLALLASLPPASAFAASYPDRPVKLVVALAAGGPADTAARVFAPYLAEALGKNRSFISQITNPSYSVPIPAAHIERIFEICHFLASEKAQFMAAYQRAHPHRVQGNSGETRWREIVLRVPDLRDRERNKQLDELMKDMLQRVLRLMEGK